MKRIILVVIFAIILIGVSAQDYKSAIGVRGGFVQGGSFKTFVGGNSAFDLIFGAYYSAANFTVLYEIHQHDVFGVDNLALFYGFGAHVGYYNSASWPTQWGVYNSGTLIGIDGVVGVEYTFDEIPINISADIVPSFNLIPDFRFVQRGAISIRYVFR